MMDDEAFRAQGLGLVILLGLLVLYVLWRT